MFDNASNLKAREISQINTRGYNRSGSSTVNVGDGGQYSSNTEIHTGVYQEIRGDDASLKELYTHISPAAMHNSAARVDAPKCHPETRKAVQEDIFSWMWNGGTDATSQPTGEILWLTGPAGAGKTAIMGTVSDKIEEGGHLAATFYFSSYKGTAETMSKRRFVTTLAYQLAVHPSLQDKLSSPILSAVRQNPAIFDMSLKRQLEALILQPLRASQGHPGSASSPRMAILIDGVDECEDAMHEGSVRSREDDQIEVLSVLLEAINEPAFPFQIIVASRPETWIRRFFIDVGAGVVTEIFLDNKYSPDDDIRLFLKSKFAELCRRYGLDPAAWPTEAVIDKLVEDASGQFIYVATVLRFIDTPGMLPQAQLEIVLRIKPQDKSNPFSLLDALYTSILCQTPRPEGTIVWLKALQLLGRSHPVLSAWTFHRIFESSAGQAQILLGGLPSLIYTAENAAEETDSAHYGSELRVSAALVPEVGWTSSYAFYHKSFPDYLEDHLRCGAAFRDIDDDTTERRLWDRFAQTLKCGGPEVPINPAFLLVFQRCFLDILVVFTRKEAMRWKMEDDILSHCEPTVWLGAPIRVPSPFMSDGSLQRMLAVPTFLAIRDVSDGGRRSQSFRSTNGDGTTGAHLASSSTDSTSDLYKIEPPPPDAHLAWPNHFNGGEVG